MKFYRSLPPLTAITFDLDDTLYDNHSVMLRLEARFLEWLNDNAAQMKRWDRKHWRVLREHALRRAPSLKNDMTALRIATIEAGLSEQGYTRPHIDSITTAAMERVYRWRNEVEILPSTHDVLSKLAKKYPLVAITNGNVDCHAIGLSHYFTHTFCAGPDGVAKPDPHLFNKAAKALDVNPESILHVGDHLISDVAGANAAGFNSAWLNTSNRSLRHSRNVESLPDIELSDLRLLLSL